MDITRSTKEIEGEENAVALRIHMIRQILKQ
jgi:hypothetical protein